MISIIAQRSQKYWLKYLISKKRNLGLLSEPSETYFGYGANLDPMRLKNNGLNANFVGYAKLLDHVIDFNVPCEYLGQGFAGIRTSPSDEVYGALFKMDKTSMRLLDVMEWVPFSFYFRKQINVASVDGLTTKAWAYFPCYPTEGLRPSEGYLNWIKSAAKGLDLPRAYLERLDAVETINNPPIDHSFCLSNPGKRRIFQKSLGAVYKYHDRLRESLARRLP